MIWALIACRPPDVEVPRYDDDPLWFPVDETSAEDRGHVPTNDGATGGPLAFEDRTEALGLGAAVSGGNTHGVALAVVDLDGDGSAEIFVGNGHANRTDERWSSAVYRNDGGLFSEASAGLPPAVREADVYSVAAADIDGDGDIDLYLGAQPENFLLLNDGGLQFTDATPAWNAGGTPSDPSLVDDGRSKLVTIGDFDGDGRLDLVSATSTQPAPGMTVLRNTGDGFEDITATSGGEIHRSGHPCAMMFTDYDNDALPDLWVWNDRGGHTLLHHDGMSWESLGSNADRTTIDHPMGIDAADIDHDGDLDYYVSNIGDHPLLINDGQGRFVNETESWGTRGSYGWGLGFEDFDRDSWPDLFVAQEDDRPWLAYRNTVGSFERTEWNAPPVRDADQAHNVPVAFADLDGDGGIDVVGAHSDGGRITVWMNAGPRAHWLDVYVPDGVGARVGVRTPDGLLQFRDITAGNSRASQSELSARFGLGGWDGAEWVVVQFPDGRQRMVTGVPGDQIIVL